MTKTNRAKVLLLGGVAVVAFSSPAMAAQPAPGGTDVVPPAGTDAAAQGQDVPQAPETASTEGDIIVTAQRREERAQDVPIVISAFSEERLEQLNVTQPQDLYGNVPSLVVGNQGQASRDVQSFSIRGQSTGFLASPAVAVYIAEVPVPASISLNLQGSPGMFVDLQNVQVLSGPQGTLFGRNTTGGAVLFEPRKPTNKFEGYIEGGIGNYDLLTMEGAVNIPIISEKLLVRVVGAHQSRRGYTKDLIWDKWRDDTNWYSGRVGITFKPTDRLENYLLGYYSKSSTNGSGQIHREFNYGTLKAVGFCADPGEIFGPSAVPCAVYREESEIAEDNGPRRTRHGINGFSKVRTWGMINTTSYELTDELTLRNIVSFQKLKDNYATDQDGTPLQQYDPAMQDAELPNFPIDSLQDDGLPLFGYNNAAGDWGFPRDSLKQFTEELQIQGNMLDDRLNFTAGAFYYNAKPDRLWGSASLTFCPALFTGLCGFSESFTGVTNKSKALYAQSTLDLGVLSKYAENLRLTTGFRYTWDTVDGFGYGYRPDPAVPANVICSVSGASVPRGDAANPFDPDFIPPTTVPPSPGVPADPGSGCRFDAKLKSKAPTWTLGLDYRPMDNVMLYTKLSRGYKAGGINTFAVRQETTVFQPEKLTSWEAGFKSDWRLGGDIPFRLNATYYFSDYKNIQRPAGDFNTITRAQGAQVLPATATIQGLEVETSIRPFRILELGATISHTDADYQEFTQEVLTPAGQFACNGGDFPGGVVPQGEVADYSCNKFQFVTPWIFNVHGTLDLPIPENLGEMSLFVNYSHFSSQNTSPLNPESFNGVRVEPGVLIDGYGLLNAALTWRNVGGSGLEAQLFGTNLTNKLYRVSNSGVFQTLGVWSELYGEPRMYGLKLKYRFGGDQ